MRVRLLACAALVGLLALPAWAVDIDLRQTDGTKTTQTGTGSAADVNMATGLGGETVGETESDGYLRVVGGIVRSTTAMTGVTTNTTSASFTIPSGSKTPIAQVSGTGAVTATVKLYGDNDGTAGNGILLSTITLTDTTKDVDVATQFTADYPYYYATTENVTGTGATVEFIIAVGIAGSGSGSGGDASAANQSTMITALQLIDNVVGVEDAGETAAGGLAMAGSVRRDTAASSAGTTGDNATVNTDGNGLLWARNMDPCSALAKTYINIDITTATTTELTSALAGASTHYYVCSLNLVTTAANNVALVDDDTDNCASVTSGLAGGLTAAEGWNFAANGGMTFGNGASSVFRTAGTNRVLCLVTSAATQLSGNMTVVAAP